MERNKEILIGLLVGVIFTFLLGVCSIIDTQYKKDAVVVHTRANTVVVQDEHGNEWGFIGTGYETGEKVVLVMDNNHTSTIRDDKIVKVK